MSTDEQADRASGGVPHAFRNALFWRWAPDMPKGLPAAFVSVLYALGTAARADGKLKFRGGDLITIKAIAAGAKTDEKDARRFIDAAICAGVVHMEGERRRGKEALYSLVVHPAPNWTAAAAHVEATRRKRPGRTPPPWKADEENGGPPPDLWEGENGGPPPDLDGLDEEGERGTAPGTGSGDRPPFGTGDRPPYNPGIPKKYPHEMADVDHQPQVEGGPDGEQITSPDQDDPTDSPAAPIGEWIRCARCHSPMMARPDRDTHAHCTADAPTPQPKGSAA